MKDSNIQVVGGCTAGVTAAIAVGRDGHEVTIVEKDPRWAVYGVGIIQQANVIPSAKQVGILDDYVAAGFGFDALEAYIPMALNVATVPSRRLVEAYPTDLGVGRPALREVPALGGPDIHDARRWRRARRCRQHVIWPGLHSRLFRRDAEAPRGVTP